MKWIFDSWSYLHSNYTRNNLESILSRGFYRTVFQLWQRNLNPPGSSCTAQYFVAWALQRFCHLLQRILYPPDFLYTDCSWNIVSDSCCWEPPPSDPQPLLGSRKIYTLWWTAHSSLLRSREDRPPGRMGSWQIFSHSRHRRSTPDGSWCPLLSGSSVIPFLVVGFQKIFCK